MEIQIRKHQVKVLELAVNKRDSGSLELKWTAKRISKQLSALRA